MAAGRRVPPRDIKVKTMYVNEFIKDTERVFPQEGRRAYLRYDMNENPEGLPASFVEMVKKEITPEFLSVYPEPSAFTKKYASYVGVKADQILATNGSDMAIRYLLETFGERGKEVVTVAPSFEMYWVNCKILGYRHVPVAYENDLTMKVENILHAISENTRIIVLLNPNNPVGNTYTREEAESVIQKAKAVGALVIIDEAYHYFYEGTFLDLLQKYDNVAILRTFSKLFSIAACRLGVIIGSKEIIHYTKNAKLTFDVNSIALLFGERLLDHPEVEAELIRQEKEGKAYAMEELKKQGYSVRDCKGNYIFVEPRKDTHDLAKALEDRHKILVKTYGNGLLCKFLRISVGSKEAMQRFLEAFLPLDA